MGQSPWKANCSSANQ